MMLGRIEVREGHFRTDRNDRQIWMELNVLLRHHIMPARARRPRRISGGMERDDGIAHWPPCGVDDPHRKRGCDERSGQDRSRREEHKSTRHNHYIRPAKVNAAVCERGYQRIRSSACAWVWRCRGVRPCSSRKSARLETWSSSTTPVKWPHSCLPAIMPDQPSSSYSSASQLPRLRVSKASPRMDRPKDPNGLVRSTNADRKRLSIQRLPSST